MGISNIARFELDLKRDLDRLSEQAEEIRQVAILKLGRRCILGTPVDTGLARNSWQFSTNAPLFRVVQQRDRTGNRALSRLGSKLSRSELGDTFFIQNRARYILTLERGRRFNVVARRVTGSEQAPQGWVRKAIRDTRREVASLAKAV